MLIEVREFYGLVKEFRRAGYYETDHLRQLFKEISSAIQSGKLIALTGVVGCGKTVTLRRLQGTLKKEGKILVSNEIRSLFRGQLDPIRTRELHEQMLAAGLPL